MFLGLDLVLYVVEYFYILYIILSRLIVLYSQCRVNRDTNMFVVYVLCNIFEFCFHYAFGLRVWHSQPVGGMATELHSTPYHLVSELKARLPSNEPPPPHPLFPPNVTPSVDLLRENLQKDGEQKKVGRRWTLGERV